MQLKLLISFSIELPTKFVAAKDFCYAVHRKPMLFVSKNFTAKQCVFQIIYQNINLVKCSSKDV